MDRSLPLLSLVLPALLSCGDATGPFQFTHVAAHQAWFATVNALAAPFWSFDVDYRVIPWTTFTEPEVARVGVSEDEDGLDKVQAFAKEHRVTMSPIRTPSRRCWKSTISAWRSNRSACRTSTKPRSPKSFVFKPFNAA